MIHVVEMLFGGDAHFMANSSMVKILTGINGENKIIFYGNRLQGQKIKDAYKDNEIIVKPLRVQGNPKYYLLPFFIIYQLLYYIKIFLKSKKDDIIVLTSIFTVTHFLLKIIKKLFPRVKLLIVLHGEVEFIEGEKKRILRLLGRFLKFALLTKNDKLTKYIVYGESIKHNIVKAGYARASEIIAIDHPYDFSLRKIHFNKENFIQIGSVGAASLEKNSHFIFELGLVLKGLISRSKLKLSIVGNLGANVFSYKNEWVDYTEQVSYIKRYDFEKQIQSLDYIVYFYDNNFYKYTASGAFFDAVKFEKPIISIKNDFISYYFSKLGNIGYLCENLEEVKSVIKKIVDNPDAKAYEQQCEALRSAKSKLSIENITIDFWAKVKFLNN